MCCILETMQAQPLSLGTLQGFLIPLLFSTLVDTAVGSGAAGGHGEKRGSADRAQNVAAAAVDTVKALAQKLPWRPYLDLFLRFLKVRSWSPHHACPCLAII
jgi:hypothetical protein